MNSKLGEFIITIKFAPKMQVSYSHRGASDLVRHCESVTHQKSEKRKVCTTSVGSFACTRNSSTDILTQKAEIKFTGFLAEHNLPIAAANHLSALVRECFPECKITQFYSCANTKMLCISNRAICPNLQQSLINEMIDSQHIIKLVLISFMIRRLS